MPAKLLLALHVLGGTSALLSMFVPMFAKKGGRAHVFTGRIYFWSMVAAAGSAIALLPVRLVERPPEAWQPSIFLAYVGLLSLTASVHGVRALRRRGSRAPVVDFALPAALTAASLAVAGWAHANGFTLGLVFSGLGLLLAISQLRVLASPPDGAGWWVGEHLVGMMVACISTLTAFLVVNAGRAAGEYALVLWLAPTAVLVPVMIRLKRATRPGGSGRAAPLSSSPPGRATCREGCLPIDGADARHPHRT